MSPKTINYNKTYFYKICCKDVSITDIYVGHTTNFTIRRRNHKFCCKTIEDRDYNLKVYRFIRENGGWDNWDMILLECCSCEGFLEAKAKERQYIELLNATLNAIIPTRTSKEYYELHKEDVKAIQKQYRDRTKDEKHEYNKEYRINNKEEIKIMNRQYRINNKDMLNEKSRLARILCEVCGIEHRRDYLSSHIKTKKHQQKLAEKMGTS